METGFDVNVFVVVLEGLAKIAFCLICLNAMKDEANKQGWIATKDYFFWGVCLVLFNFVLTSLLQLVPMSMAESFLAMAMKSHWLMMLSPIAVLCVEGVAVFLMSVYPTECDRAEMKLCDEIFGVGNYDKPKSWAFGKWCDMMGEGHVPKGFAMAMGWILILSEFADLVTFCRFCRL